MFRLHLVVDMNDRMYEGKNVNLVKMFVSKYFLQLHTLIFLLKLFIRHDDIEMYVHY